MNLKASRTILFLALVGMFAAAAPVWGQSTCPGGSDKATWTASPTTLSVNVGSTGDLSVSVTSPMCLNTYPDFPNMTSGLPVFTDVALDSSVCPDGSSGNTATCTLTAPIATIPGNPQYYTQFGQSQTYGVHFDATEATAGTYTFHVHANASDPDQQHQNGNNLDSYGWGYGGGVELTVTVVSPQATCDPNDTLNVSFAKPQNNSKVTFCTGGTTIPIDVTASDTSNLIKSLLVSATTPDSTKTDISSTLAITGTGTTSANATGNYAAQPAGAYAFDANAETQCTTGSASVSISLVYDLSGGLLGPLAGGQKPKKGHTVPIQFQPKDCSGSVAPEDTSVEVKVYDASGTTLLMDAKEGSCTGSGCGSGSSSDVAFSSTGYQSNFVTGSTAATYTVEIWFDGILNYTTTFTTE